MGFASDAALRALGAPGLQERSLEQAIEARAPPHPLRSPTKIAWSPLSRVALTLG